MNIKEAKEEVKRTVVSYLAKDEYGQYIIPQHKQRPVFLLGAPGIGKTEIMSQIASELEIPMLSYSMTHHTRQSAIGLPIIKKEIYDDEEYSISEYTMSEIIASIHRMIKTTGKRNGILFLDEINCVSETLSPIILQFLQYKVFGGHKVPEGWIVVTAGNPPEYNNSVHDFDVVTWDRLKKIEVEPDFDTWKEYAYEAGVHLSIITYLENKKKNFYHIEQNVDGKSFVTARGWDDLSRIIKVYESMNYPVNKQLVMQYINDEKIARDFSVYYDLYKKYKSDYHIKDIIEGTYSDEILERAENGSYDEKFSIVGLLIEAMSDDAKRINTTKDVMIELKKKLKPLENSEDVIGEMENIIADIRNDIVSKGAANSLSRSEKECELIEIALLAKYIDAVKTLGGNYASVVTAFNIDIKKYYDDCDKVKKHFHNIFTFGDEAFGKDSQQLLILCTEAVASSHISRYIKDSKCPEYFEHDDVLMFHKRNMDIIKELGNLEDLEAM